MYDKLVEATKRAFSQDYSDARAGFISDAHSMELEVSSLRHPLNGPEGEKLYTDHCWIGDPDAGRVLVLISGTHGVEGFCGSAAQRDALQIWNRHKLPKNVAILMIHAINPHGFAWLRRVTEDNIDLNRNFVDFSQPLPQNEGYVHLAEALLGPVDDRSAQEKLDAYANEHGEAALYRAIIAGQYTHPNGLFYGGTEPCWSRLQIEHLIEIYGLPQRQCVGVIDFHTGLGPFGYGDPLCDLPLESKGADTCRKWYGDSLSLGPTGKTTSYASSGLSDYGWHRLLGDRLAHIALEFGTYDLVSLFSALKADHRLHAQGAVDWHAPEVQAVKNNLKNFFFPNQKAWKEMVLFRSRQVINQAITGLKECP